MTSLNLEMLPGANRFNISFYNSVASKLSVGESVGTRAACANLSQGKMLSLSFCTILLKYFSLWPCLDSLAAGSLKAY